jgi:hypothetical protein
MTATARWLERFVRDTCRADRAFAFRARRDDVGTLDSIVAMLSPVNEPRAQMALSMAKSLRAQCPLDDAGLAQMAALVGMIEGALA